MKFKGDIIITDPCYIIKDNPDFDYHINREWTTTLIKDFDGEVNYYVDSEDDACIIGVGNINFFTS